jgi:hypothetical protein
MISSSTSHEKAVSALLGRLLKDRRITDLGSGGSRRVRPTSIRFAAWLEASGTLPSTTVPDGSGMMRAQSGRCADRAVRRECENRHREGGDLSPWRA